MNEEQQKAFELLMSGENVCLTGPAGVGKSYTINNFVEHTTKKVAVTSTTGISASLINGRTIHSWAGIKLGDEETNALLVRVKKNKDAKERILGSDVLIIDEISMMDAELFEKLEFIIRVIRYNDKPFGGLQVVAVGDFAQLPPVKAKGFTFIADCWDKVFPSENIIHLKQVMRQTDKNFVDVLNKIRFADPCLLNPENSLRKLLDERVIEQGKVVKIEVDGYELEPTLLYSHRADVSFINSNRLSELLKTEEHHKFNIEMVLKKESHKQYIDAVLKRVPCNKILELAVGAQVMLVKNMDFDAKLVNGSRGVVTRFVKDEKGNVIGIDVLFKNGESIILGKADWEVKIDKNIKITVRQYPLILAYALTVHKSQGSTLDFVTVDLSQCFAEGQVYTALSRARSLDGLFILDIDYTKIKTHPGVKSFYGIE